MLNKNKFMKIKLVLSLALLVVTTESFSQFSFGISPGISFNSVNLGISNIRIESKTTFLTNNNDRNQTYI